MMKNLPVLITGASSGIGKKTALLLSSKGFYVFAGVRNSNDGDNLIKEASENLTPLLLDVIGPKILLLPVNREILPMLSC